MISRLFLLSLLAAQASFATETHPLVFPLQQNWEIKDATEIQGDDAKISSTHLLAHLREQHWLKTEVPSTVLGAILKNEPDFDPFYAKNLRTLPGTLYDIGKNYSDVNTPPESPYSHAWWFRTAFQLPENFQGKTIDLHLQGVNYSAEVWLNGKKIAGQDQIEGMYRTYSLPITAGLHSARKNILAIKIFPPDINSLVANWADWSPTPQDKNMGLWREVYLSAHDSIEIQHPQVLTKLDLPLADLQHATAHLTVETTLVNTSSQVMTGTLKGEIEGVSFSKSVKLGAGESQAVSFSAQDFPQLNLVNARLWWPAQMGKPELYTLKLNYSSTAATDEVSIPFGIREVSTKLVEGKSRLYLINGKPILIRGGGWASDMFLRWSRERMEKELQYVLQMNLNAIRLEGMMQPEYFYDLTDRLGILVMPGWVCCNKWQNRDDNETWTDPKTKVIANASLHDQLIEMRPHPSIITFLYGSDRQPTDETEKMYLDTFAEVHWPNDKLASASYEDRANAPLGQSGVKMNGPYNYEPPSYWLRDTTQGGAFGFNTETSPGPAVPTIDSLKKFIPADQLWPINEIWNYHAGSDKFATLDLFNNAQNKRYGESHSLEEYEAKAQVMAYDGERAMFEAFGRNKYQPATGVIQWMMNNAWPSFYWHLYDYYLNAGGGFYGVRKAAEAIHAQYSYDDNSIVLVNSTIEQKQNITVRIQVLDFSLKSLFDEKTTLPQVAEDSTLKLLTLPKIDGLTKTYFVKLTVTGADEKELSNNFYWLSTQTEVFDPKDSDYTHLGVTQEGDLTLLNSLPPVNLQVTSTINRSQKSGSVTLTNPDKALAFSIHLALIAKSTGAEILPTLWDDNYLSLLPGETREIHFSYPLADFSAGTSNDDLNVTVEGWNIQNKK